MLAPEILEAPTLSATEAGYVNTFLKANGDPGIRQGKLAKHVDPATTVLPHFSHPSHHLFVAHWGDSNEAIAKVASWLYNAKAKTDRKTGQSIAVFRQGTPAALEGDDPFVADRLVIETGTIGTNDHGLSNYSHHLGPAKSRPETKGPSARFFSQVSVLDRQIITVDYLASVETLEGEGWITLYDGVVPMEADEYDRGRHTTVYPAAIGNLACFDLLQELADKVSVRSGSIFTELFAEGDIGPGKLLPDLSLIFPPLEESASNAEELIAESA
ncbi:MAG TPA: hypothetical protein VHB51_00535 [Candidatus Saccharimonadales bacterium]|nr:hypothetical protein [Candidatus Saccharimonadales bacterium]